MPSSGSNVTLRWTTSLGEFLPCFLMSHSVLGRFLKKADVLLHGSTTIGIDDPVSDLDLWFIMPGESLSELDRLSVTRFFEFELECKLGHLNATSAEVFSGRIAAGDISQIAELRSAVPIIENLGIGTELIELACRPMSTGLSRALFFFHYVEMRGWHTSCDNPMERGNAVASLLSLSETLSHALKAAMVLDGQPYPYEKWLWSAAYKTPTGRRLAPDVEKILDFLAQDALRVAGPHKKNPLNNELHLIRSKLIHAAGEKGIDAPWLKAWYLYMAQAREAKDNACWP